MDEQLQAKHQAVIQKLKSKLFAGKPYEELGLLDEAILEPSEAAPGYSEAWGGLSYQLTNWLEHKIRIEIQHEEHDLFAVHAIQLATQSLHGYVRLMRTVRFSILDKVVVEMVHYLKHPELEETYRQAP